MKNHFFLPAVALILCILCAAGVQAQSQAPTGRAQYDLAQHYFRSFHSEILKAPEDRDSRKDWVYDGVLALYWFEKAIKNEDRIISKEDRKTAKANIGILKKNGLHKVNKDAYEQDKRRRG